VPWAYFWAALLLAVLYAVKFLVRRWAPGQAAALYGALLALSLPYLYTLVVVDWENPHVAPLGCWVGVPVMLLLVPTASFLLDWSGKVPPGLDLSAARAVIEAGLVSAWVMTWLFVECFVLGWVWL
jgi:hypothetical protein